MQTFSGLAYLKIDIASNFGLDKLDWDQRIAWTDSHITHLEDLLDLADTPALYFAGVQALRKTQKGEASGYPISLDATASGLQLLACLTGCETSARLCNVVSTGHREDAYTVIYKSMGETMDEIADSVLSSMAKINPEAATISREDCKVAIMTSLYSSTAEPKRVFGEGDLLRVFYQTMETMAPGAWGLNRALQTLWQPGALSHDWVMPDNFHAHVKVTKQVTEFVQFLNTPIPVSLTVNQGTKTGRSISPNLIHSLDGMIVREMHRRCSYDTDKLERLMEALLAHDATQFAGTAEGSLVDLLWGHYLNSGFLSVRILDHLTKDNLHLVDIEVIKKLIGTLPDKPFDLISIHDCFRCLPNYGNDLRRQYNQILSDIAKSDMLMFLSSQVVGKYMPVIKRGDISQKILDADYAIC